MKKINKKWLSIFSFTIIFLLAAFLRLFMLGHIPAGLTNDEANLGYDAFSILHTGRDQWGNFLPLVFKGFGDYPAPFYRYLAVPFIYFFGLSAFAIRLPSALLGIASVVLIFFVAEKFFKRPFSYFAMFFLAISPWAMGTNRTALEVNLALFLVLSALLCFSYAKKNFLAIVGMVFFFALTLYTYSAYTLFTPLMLLVLFTFLYTQKFITLKKITLSLILLFIFITPLLLTRSSTAEVRFSQIGVFNNINSIGLVNTLNDQRGACLKYLPTSLCKAENNKVILFSTTLIKNYLNHFSFTFLFISGTKTQFSVLPEGGLEYIFSSLFLILGIFFFLKQPFQQKIFLLFLLLSPIPDSLTGDGNYIRAFLMVPFLAIVEAGGVCVLYEQIKKLRASFQLPIFIAALCIIFGSITVFSITYFTYFRDNYSRYSQYGYQAVMKYIYANRHNYDRIYITTSQNDAKQYVYYLFYTQYNPLRYEKKINVSYHTNSDGWIWIDRIDNVYFVPTLNSTYMKGNNLLVSTPTDFPKNCPTKIIIRDRVNSGLFEAITSKQLTYCYSEKKL